jgi:hypothetical protein
MNCPFDNERLSAYLDNEVTETERGQIEAHINGCNHCRELVRSFRQNDAVFHKAVQSEMPADYWNSYQMRLAGKLTHKPGAFRRTLFWSALVPIAAGILFVLTFYRGLFVAPPSTTLPASDDVVFAEARPTTPFSLMASSEAVLVNIANMDENDLFETGILKRALAESGLVEKIRLTKLTLKNKDIQIHLGKLEAVFIWVQNGDSPIELQALKEVIINNGLIEENKNKRHSEWR